MDSQPHVHVVILGIEGRVYDVRVQRDIDAALALLGQHLIDHAEAKGTPVEAGRAYMEFLRQVGDDPKLMPSSIVTTAVEGDGPPLTPARLPGPSPHALGVPQAPQPPPPPPRADSIGPHRSFGAGHGSVGPGPEIRDENALFGSDRQQRPSSGGGAVVGGRLPGPPPSPEQLARPGTIAIGHDENGWGLCVSGQHQAYFPEPSAAVEAVRSRIPTDQWARLPVYVVGNGHLMQIDLAEDDPLGQPMHSWAL